MVLPFCVEERSYMDIINGDIRTELRVLGAIIKWETTPTPYSAQVRRLKLQDKPEWIDSVRRKMIIAGDYSRSTYSSGFYFHMAITEFTPLSPFLEADTQITAIQKLRKMARDGKRREMEDYVTALESKYASED